MGYTGDEFEGSLQETHFGWSSSRAILGHDDDMDPVKVVRYPDAKLEILMKDPGIVCSGLKILSSRSNALAERYTSIMLVLKRSH